jgi:hypothetical protein
MAGMLLAFDVESVIVPTVLARNFFTIFATKDASVFHN